MPTCNKSVIIKMISMIGKGCSSTPPCIYSDYSVEEESMQFIGFNEVATFKIISRHEQTELYLFSEKVILTPLFPAVLTVSSSGKLDFIVCEVL